ncbi:MAG: hypothetical protein ABI811_03370 [Acidobacteriota bacterium]
MSEFANHSQGTCPEAGLNCEGCTMHTANELAQVCKGLRGKMIAQMFVQLYPAPECSRMHAHFAAAYKDASRVLFGDVSEDIPKRSPQSETPGLPRVLVAVA